MTQAGATASWSLSAASLPVPVEGVVVIGF
jgi:hypothetical protein